MGRNGPWAYSPSAYLFTMHALYYGLVKSLMRLDIDLTECVPGDNETMPNVLSGCDRVTVCFVH